MEYRKQLGDNAEEIARQYLEQKGYRTVQSHNRYGEPLETVDYTKQKKIKKASAYFLYIHPQLAHCYCRYDIVSVLWKNGCASVTWLQDAFQ